MKVRLEMLASAARSLYLYSSHVMRWNSKAMLSKVSAEDSST